MIDTASFRVYAPAFQNLFPDILSQCDKLLRSINYQWSQILSNTARTEDKSSDRHRPGRHIHWCWNSHCESARAEAGQCCVSQGHQNAPHISSLHCAILW